jgi:triosephosphate isomerase
LLFGVDGTLVGSASLKAEEFWGIAAFAGPA